MFSSDDDDNELILLICSSDDDDDGDKLVPTEQRLQLQRKIRRVNYMQSLDDAEFTFRFRLTKAAVEMLLTEITPLLPVTSTRNHGVSPLHQLMLSLRFYALGTILISVADFIGVSRSTASRIVRDVSATIASLVDRYIFIQIQAESIEKFYRIAGFPRIFASIDCTHVRIQSPSHIIGEEFRNHKGYLSINVQAACDADLRLLNVVARWPGSTHDSTIFNKSVLKAQCEAGQFGKNWMLGDNAYPNKHYLLTPLLNPVTEADKRYNEAHIKTRNTIERTFGIWKRRFPVMALTLRLSLKNIQSVIIATAVLHNICRNNNLTEIPVEVEIPPDEGDVDDPGAPEPMDPQDIKHRSDLINNYFS